MPSPILLSNRDDYGLLVDASDAGSAATIGPDRLTQVNNLTVYVAFNKSAVGGSVVIESSHNANHDGEWFPLSKVEWVKGGKVQFVSLPGPHLYVRVKVEKPVISGTVSVYAVAN
jgi:hypothetical protein